MTTHPGGGTALTFAIVVAFGVGAYVFGVWCARARGRHWPGARVACWSVGWSCVTWAVWPPRALGMEWMFTQHMIEHVLLGMAGPLLLVGARPVSLLLCALPQREGRAVVHGLDTPYMRLVSHPVTAAALDMGGLWVLYTTGLFHAMHDSAWVAALVHLHVFAAGCLFTVAVTQLEPTRRPRSFGLRAGVLVAAIAVHDILAKSLYANGDLGMSVTDTQRGAMLMYYLGDAVDLALVVIVCAGWYRATGRHAAKRDARHAVEQSA